MKPIFCHQSNFWVLASWRLFLKRLCNSGGWSRSQMKAYLSVLGIWVSRLNLVSYIHKKVLIAFISLIWHTCKYTLRLHPTARLTIGHKIKNRLERRKKKSQFPPLIWYQTSFDTQKQMLGSCCPFYNSTTIFVCIFLWFWLAQLRDMRLKKKSLFFSLLSLSEKKIWVNSFLKVLSFAQNERVFFSEMLFWVKWTSLKDRFFI